METGQAERERKANIGLAVRVMKDSAAYKAVMARIEDRCGSGKWWKGWVEADEAKAKIMREMAKGYLAFDALVDQIISEGDAARKLLDAKGNDLDNSSSPR